MRNTLMACFVFFLLGCKPEIKELEANRYSEAYKSIDSLASLISRTEPSKDTIFMGFRFGMNKTEYRQRIKDLRKDGFKIEFIEEYIYMNININNTYMIETDISFTKENVNYTGVAEFLLIPEYNDEEGMVRLTVLNKIDWNGKDPNIFGGWFKNRLREEYSVNNIQDRMLGRFITEIHYPSNYSDWLGKKGRMNVMSLTNSHIIFSSDKELLRNVLSKKIDETSAKDSSDKIKF